MNTLWRTTRIRQEKDSDHALNDLDLLIAKAFSIGDR
jgi:hypothetical protein